MWLMRHLGSGIKSKLCVAATRCGFISPDLTRFEVAARGIVSR